MDTLRTLYQKFLNIGIFDNQPVTLQNRILYSNIILIVNIFVIAIPFAIVSSIFFPQLTFLPIIFLVGCFTSLLFSHFGFNIFGRLLQSILPIIIFSIYHAFIITNNEVQIIQLSLLLLAFSIIPFIVFELREKSFLIIALSFVFINIVLFQKLNSIFEMSIAHTILSTSYVQFFLSIAVILIFFLFAFIFASTTKSCENKALVLIEEIQNTNNEISNLRIQLSSTIDEMETFKAEQVKLKELEKQREWINTGITKFVDILRLNNDNIEELTYNVISNLVKYLDANQGGIFMLVDEKNDLEDSYFDLTAAYAYDKRKFLKKKILQGEGLIGNCALEKKHIYLSKIPQDYIKITSGLGDATPNSLLLIPIINDDKVYGVIEIASFNQFNSFEIEFVKKVAENIGSAILNTLMHKKTNALIEEMKKQAEFNQTQEEELRQNIEEMQATQEEMAKKERVLREFAEELGINEEMLAERIQRS